MLSSDRLEQARDFVTRNRGTAAPVQCVFFSVSDGPERAVVVHAAAEDFDTAWARGAGLLRARMRRRGLKGRWLRVDWLETAEPVSGEAFRERLKRTKRNYFRLGVCFDGDFARPLLEQELNANAILYGGAEISHATLNAGNLNVYARQRFGAEIDPQVETVTLLHTRGAFFDETGSYLLCPEGLSAGRRQIDRLSADDVGGLVRRGSRYLAGQVDADGRFGYGWFPCFDRPIQSYNCLRHASTTYAMIEAWEATREPELKAAIDRSLAYLTSTHVAVVGGEDGAGDDGPAAMLVDTGDEIKLGGNAVLILALTKYCQTTGTRDYLALAEQLARGIRRMQDAGTGRFVHVLNFPDLSVKEESRIIYYEGEAAFALMRLYALTGDERWLDMVEKAFSHFIAKRYWRQHDHWLSYCVNELTLHRPREAYYRFGIDNFLGHLDFVATRITTFPTLLELMMAARAMLTRLAADPRFSHLLKDVQMDKFHHALEWRAHHLLDGHFWPELAMYYRHPDRILGSFFIRHHAFRVRIDDVEHYLSGLVAYLGYICSDAAREAG